jgi:hypothetical protein
VEWRCYCSAAAVEAVAAQRCSRGATQMMEMLMFGGVQTYLAR